jgi:hypothetical protein
MTLWNHLKQLEKELRQTLFSWQGLGILSASMLVVLVVLQLVYPMGLN